MIIMNPKDINRINIPKLDLRPKSPNSIGQRQYLEFCRQHNYKAVPTSDKTLCLFTSHLAVLGLPCHVIRAYLSSAIQLHVLRDYPDPTAGSTVYKMISKGIKLNQSLISKPCLPINNELMKTIKKTLKNSPHYSSEDKIALWAAFAVAFCGCISFDEFCSPTVYEFDNSTLLWQDIDIKYENVTISIKNAMFGEHFIYMSATEKSVCPARALIKYKHYRRVWAKNLPAFILDTGKFLTSEILIMHLKKILQESGIDTELFSSYSFQIGAAVSALESGVEPSLIKTLCRLSAEACQLYSNTSTDVILQATKQLCS